VHTREFVRTTSCRCIAEIGIGEGDTSLVFAAHTAPGGELHLFDFADRVDRVARRLAEAGHHHVHGHGCSRRLMDSYNWPLGLLLAEHSAPIFDYVYIDGAHTWAHDALAFLLCDRLLVPGGFVDFDDYWWTMAGSTTVSPAVRPATLERYTEEQIQTPQIRMVVELLVKRDPRYEPVVPNRIFRKLA
jgi:predicted O-methyltransferase YrrM